MNKDLTELVFIIDESGSMSGLEGDTISGFNSTIKKQRKVDGKCLVSTVLFADGQKILHDRIDLKEIKDKPAKTMFIITTDGMENASRKYSSNDVKKMIEEQKEKGWEFIFLAANIDAVNTAKKYGIDENSTVNYVNDKRGNKIKYECMSNAISEVRINNCIDKSGSWKKASKIDYEKRGKKVI